MRGHLDFFVCATREFRACRILFPLERELLHFGQLPFPQEIKILREINSFFPFFTRKMRCTKQWNNGFSEILSSCEASRHTKRYIWSPQNAENSSHQAQNYEMGEIPINTRTPPIHFPWENSISGVHIIRKPKGRMRCHGSYVWFLTPSN